MKKYVIIGAGPAGAKAAETLRRLDEESRITVVTTERYPFYKRERIAGLISGEETEEGLFEKGRDFFEENGAVLLTDRVTQVSSEKNQLTLGGGSTINYDSLLVASGGKPILPNWPGIQFGGISTLYTLDDAKKVSKLVEEATNALVIGGGTIAMKVVPILRKLGLKVTLVEKASHLWPRTFDKKASEIVENSLGEGGAEVLLNEEGVELQGKDGKIRSVSLKSQRTLPCDLFLVTMGMQPRIDFLRGSGIALDLGVLVDHRLRTNVRNIYAAGDVAQAPDVLLRVPALHPTWAHAEEQGEIAAHNMAGVETEYEGAVPLFSVGVYGIGVVTAGITQPQPTFDEVSRFSPHESSYRKFVLQDNRLVGALVIGKGLDRKSLKRQLKKAVLNMVDVGTTKNDLLREDFEFNLLLKET